MEAVPPWLGTHRKGQSCNNFQVPAPVDINERVTNSIFTMRFIVTPQTLDGLPWDLKDQLNSIEGCATIDVRSFTKIVVDVSSEEVLDSIRSVFGEVPCEITKVVQENAGDINS